MQSNFAGLIINLFDMITFENLPQSVQKLFDKVESIEKLIIEQSVNQPDPEKDLLTVDEAAEFLNLAKPTIYGLLHRKELPNMKRGKKVYFSKKDLIDYLQAGRRKSMEQLKEERKSLGFNNKMKGLNDE